MIFQLYHLKTVGLHACDNRCVFVRALQLRNAHAQARTCCHTYVGLQSLGDKGENFNIEI